MTSPLRDLTTAARKDGLNLFLGAGFSMSAGLPSWGDLTKLMIGRAYPHSMTYPYDMTGVVINVLSSATHVESMRIVRKKLGERFIDELRNALYGQFKEYQLLAQVIVNSNLVRFICSYNFDDILEQAFITEKRRFCVLVPGDRFPPDNVSGMVPIAHPHGLVPMFAEPTHVPADIWGPYVEGVMPKGTHDVIITEDDYHRLYAEVLCWSNIVQLRALFSRPCVFIGCSLYDPNVRRLLGISNAISPYPHWAIFQHPFSSLPAETKGGWGGMLRFPLETANRDLKEAIGITPIFVDSYDEVPAIIDGLSASTT